MRVGLDIGSTTIKCVVLDENDQILYSSYNRHYSHIIEKTKALLTKINDEFLHNEKTILAISGSAGMGLADSCAVPFVQEVYAERVAAKRCEPDTDVIIELGGEDAKILFLTSHSLTKVLKQVILPRPFTRQLSIKPLLVLHKVDQSEEISCILVVH